MYVTKKVHASGPAYGNYGGTNNNNNNNNRQTDVDSTTLYKEYQRATTTSNSRITGTLGLHLTRLKDNIATFRRRDRSQSGSMTSSSTDDSSFRDHTKFLSCETSQTVDTRDDMEDRSSPISIVTVEEERDDTHPFPSRLTSPLPHGISSQTNSHPANLRSPSSLHKAYRSTNARPTQPFKSRAILKQSTYGTTATTNHRQQNTTKKTAKIKSCASFSTLEIREYQITLGNNPGGYQGPPISLDWNHDDEKTIRMSLDEYEMNRLPRRDENDMYLPECLRRWKLLENGISMKAMQKATKAAEATRRQRRNTIESFKQLPPSGYLSGLKTKLKR